MLDQSIYACQNRFCPEHGREFTGMHIKEYRIATGKFVTCHECGEAVSWLGTTTERL
jgi:hypothetical protein